MAIYHFSAQVISRSKGQSAVAAAAYRSGEQLHEERTGENKYYARKVKPETMILSPQHAPDWVRDRNRLWNEVEQMEKRKNSQLAREINVALPKELSNEQQMELIKNYVQTELVDKGMIADIAIHRDDKENPHAHVMLTTRDISEEGLTTKNREWNDRELLKRWREEWANHANKALEKEGIQEQISHLSHEARGLEQLPTIHLGHVAHEMEQKGVQTDRGNINRERQQYNAMVVDLQKYHKEKQMIEQRIARKQSQQEKFNQFYTASERVAIQKASLFLKTEASLSNIEKRFEQLDKWELKIQKNTDYLRWKEGAIQKASEQYAYIHLFTKQVEENQQKKDTINWLNPLKLKENLAVKKELEQKIEKLINDIEYRKDALTYHQDKLGFRHENEFKVIQSQHQTDYPVFLEKNREARGRINEERKVLSEAQKAHEKAFVRGVASLYPNHPEMSYLSLSIAQNIHKINRINQQVVPISTIRATLDHKKDGINRLENVVSNMERNQEVGKAILEKSVESERQGIGLLESIITGLEQASRNMQMREQHLQKQQGKKRRKNQGLER